MASEWPRSLRSERFFKYAFDTFFATFEFKFQPLFKAFLEHSLFKFYTNLGHHFESHFETAHPKKTKINPRSTPGASKTRKAAISKTLKTPHFFNVFRSRRLQREPKDTPRHLPKKNQELQNPPKKNENGIQYLTNVG